MSRYLKRNRRAANAKKRRAESKNRKRVVEKKKVKVVSEYGLPHKLDEFEWEMHRSITKD